MKQALISSLADCRMEPVNAEEGRAVRDLDLARFLECEGNIGMYKFTQQVPLDKLKPVVAATFKSWSKKYNLLYPAQPHESWDALPDEEFREVFLASLRMVSFLTYPFGVCIVSPFMFRTTCPSGSRCWVKEGLRNTSASFARRCGWRPSMT